MKLRKKKQKLDYIYRDKYFEYNICEGGLSAVLRVDYGRHTGQVVKPVLKPRVLGLKVVSLERCFSNRYFSNQLDISEMDTRYVTNMSSMFINTTWSMELDLSSLNTGNVTDMSSMFMDSNIEKINFGGIDTSKLEDISYMFCNCNKLKSIDLSGFNTSNMKYMRNMFQFCANLEEVNISSFDTSNVKSMSEVFMGCEKLKHVDLSNIITANVVTFNKMFYDCTSLTELDMRKVSMESYEFMIGMNTKRLFNTSSLAFVNLESVTNFEVSIDYRTVVLVSNLSENFYDEVNNHEAIILVLHPSRKLKQLKYNGTEKDIKRIVAKLQMLGSKEKAYQLTVG